MDADPPHVAALLLARGRGRNRLRQLKLQRLGCALEGSAIAPLAHDRVKPDAVRVNADPVKELDKVADKLQIFEKLVGILTRKSATLEAKCMQLEEQSLKQAERVSVKQSVLDEGKLVSCFA